MAIGDTISKVGEVSYWGTDGLYVYCSNVRIFRNIFQSKKLYHVLFERKNEQLETWSEIKTKRGTLKTIWVFLWMVLFQFPESLVLETLANEITKFMHGKQTL